MPTITKILHDRLLILCAILLASGFLRFYKLDWGEGFFFHPDEYHIAISANQLRFPSQMNPNFFSYGSFIVYSIFITKSLVGTFHSILDLSNPFGGLDVILIGRFYSAIFSTLTVFFSYLILKQITKRSSLALLGAFLAGFNPGLIQQAHFATPESILTFWLLAAFYFALKFTETRKATHLVLASLCLGFGLATKIVALTFAPVILFVILLAKLPLKRKLVLLACALTIVGIVFLLVYPYSVLDSKNFFHSMRYETSLARGLIPVFYTRQFINTPPFVFHLTKIFPYTIDPGTYVVGLVGILVLVVSVPRSLVKGKVDKPTFFTLIFFLSYFLPNAFLFAKWTRFVAPIFPFFAFFAVLLIYRFKEKVWQIFAGFVAASAFVYTVMFFSIYTRHDVRVTANSWLTKNVPAGAMFLTEAGNMLEVPLNTNHRKTSFDFYGYEGNQALHYDLPRLLYEADYFIVQSRRIYVNHQRLSNEFPKTSAFYSALFSGELGFEKVKEFRSHPTLSVGKVGLQLVDEGAEETWTVFDHPVIKVYKKTRPLTIERYEEIL